MATLECKYTFDTDKLYKGDDFKRNITLTIRTRVTCFTIYAYHITWKSNEDKKIELELAANAGINNYECFLKDNQFIFSYVDNTYNNRITNKVILNDDEYQQFYDELSKLFEVFSEDFIYDICKK